MTHVNHMRRPTLPSGEGEPSPAAKAPTSATPYASVLGPQGAAFSAFGRLGAGGACRASGENAPEESAALAFDGGEGRKVLGGGGGGAPGESAAGL